MKQPRTLIAISAFYLSAVASVIGEDLEWRISPIFEEALPFSANGLAAVKHKGKWGYINLEGKGVIQNTWDVATPFHQGAALVRRDSLWGLISEDGRQLVEPSLLAVSHFRDGLAFAMDETHFGALDVRGEWKFRLPHASAGINKEVDFAEDGRFNRDRIVRLERFADILVIKAKTFAIALTTNGTALHIDFPIRLVPDKWYNTREVARVFDDGVALKQDDRVILLGEAGVIFDSNSAVAQDSFPGGKFECEGFSDGVAGIGVNHNRTGFLAFYVSASGQILRKFTNNHPSLGSFDSIYRGRAPYPFMDETKGSIGYITAEGAVAIEPKWKGATQFNEAGFAMVDNDGVFETIDTDGNVVAVLPEFTPEAWAPKLPSVRGSYFLTAGSKEHVLDKLINEKGEEVFPEHNFPKPVGETHYFVAQTDLDWRSDNWDCGFSVFKGEEDVIARFRNPKPNHLIKEAYFGSPSFIEALTEKHPFPHRTESGIGYVTLPDIGGR